MLVLVLESKVQGLRGEVPDDVGEVTTPIAEESLLFGDADEAVDHTCEGTRLSRNNPFEARFYEKILCVGKISIVFLLFDRR